MVTSLVPPITEELIVAREAHYTAQLPPTKGTPTHRDKVAAEAETRRISMGQVIRESLDERYKLVDGQVVGDVPVAV